MLLQLKIEKLNKEIDTMVNHINFLIGIRNSLSNNFDKDRNREKVQAKITNLRKIVTKNLNKIDILEE